MNRYRKILIAAYGFFPAREYGGPPVSIDNFCSHIRGSEVYIVARDHELSGSKRLKGVTDGWNKRVNCSVMYLSDAEYTKKSFERIILEISPDVIYIQTLFQTKTFLSAVFAAGKHKIPVLLAPRGELCDGAMKKKYKKIPYIYLMKFAGIFKDMYFQATSEEEHRKILFYLNRDEGRVFDLSNFPTTPAERIKNAANTGNNAVLKIVTICRIVPKKNTLYALECMKDVKARIEWDIYGQIEDRVYWAECLKAVNALPENIRVRHAGSIEHEEIFDTLRKYNVFFSPTRSENFGHAIVEAMFAGCIPVISNQTPWTELEEHRAGFSLPLNDKKAFSAAIDRLSLMDREELSLWSSNAQKYIETKTDTEELSRKYAEAFEEIAAGKRENNCTAELKV